ncbi:hypothetical protein BJ985_000966 [Corynebacterium tuberculostearicum]|nr:hypothetical protein [Corynebacterium tuberculostearicum]
MWSLDSFCGSVVLWVNEEGTSSFEVWHDSVSFVEMLKG